VAYSSTHIVDYSIPCLLTGARLDTSLRIPRHDRRSDIIDRLSGAPSAHYHLHRSADPQSLHLPPVPARSTVYSCSTLFPPPETPVTARMRDGTNIDDSSH